MRKLEAVTREIVDELGYLQRREMKMRDTNGASISMTHTQSRCQRLTLTDANRVESTNDRVKTFSILIMVGIVALGGWQVSIIR